YRGTLESLERGELLFILPRPGGHHAGRSGWAMGAPTLGFCIFNFAAAAAKALLDRGLKVLMIDFDAHHGNGTQDIFWEEPRVVHIDIHEEDIYPGTGHVDDIGGGGAEGTKINVPLPAFSGNPQYLWTLENVVKPLIEAFKPEAIVVSAGFDAYEGDPLTMLRATDETYEAIASTLRELWTGGRLKSIVTNLEGGYGEGLGKGLKAYVEALAGARAYVRRAEPRGPPERTLRELSKILSKYWGLEEFKPHSNL
ncbi:MAG: histone deacetylase family protein, partial [Acidilobaceae archaeon]